jgi:uncharacterized Zn finger protein
MEIICPECESDNIKVIKERGRELTLKCRDCGYVWQVTLGKTVKIPIIVSKHERSFKQEAELPIDEEIAVGDIVELENDEVKITSIELEGNRRVRKAKIGEVKTLWGESLSYPKIIGVSIYLKGGITQSFKVQVNRDEEFMIGDIYKVGDFVFKLEKIKTENKMLKHGKATAEKIVRLMGRPTRGRPVKTLEIYRGHRD